MISRITVSIIDTSLTLQEILLIEDSKRMIFKTKVSLSSSFL